MDTSDLSLLQFLIQELRCEPIRDGIVSLEELLKWCGNLPQDIPQDEQQSILSVKFKSENYSHIRLRLEDNFSFEIIKETVGRYYREAGYEVDCYVDSETNYLLEAKADIDTIQISCRIQNRNVLEILVA